MCGIWAIFGCNASEAKCFQSFMKVSHRGPDAFRMENIIHYKNCFLGFHQLVIMDDKTGMMPLKLMSYPNLVLVYNGEIYNHAQLADEYGFQTSTTSDAECILHLYNKGGIDFTCRQLDGVFGFLLLDLAQRKIHIARDCYGVRPLFKKLTSCRIFGVCSEAKGLVGMPGQGGIKWLLPGRSETYDLDTDGKVTFGQGAQFHAPGQPPMYKTFQENPGGLDSSLVTALVVKFSQEMRLGYPIQTFSVGMPGSPDVMAARQVSKYLGTDHHELCLMPDEGIKAIEKVIYHLESYDVSTVRSAVGLYVISKYISEKTENVVVFSGEGSDEVTQGYCHFHRFGSAEEADAESRLLVSDLYLFDVLRADRMTAACGLELRVPFLDHKFTSTFLEFPPDLRRPRQGIEKFLLRKAFENTGLLPNDILWRSKVPLSLGLSSKEKPWYTFVEEHVNTQVPDEKLNSASTEFPFNPPGTKEAYYYRQLFEKYYPGMAELIPYFWMLPNRQYTY